MIRLPARPLAALCLSATLVGGLSGCGSSDTGAGSPAASTSPTSATDTLITAGLSALGSGDTAAATASFRAILEIDPTNVYANYNLGYIAQTAGQTKKALGYYDTALVSDPTFASALYNKAYLTEETDLDAAIALYRRTVAADPDNARAYMRMGFALLHQGSTAEGEEALAQGVRLDPSMTTVTAPEYDAD